ncbi:MAG: glycosyltransferase family 2 protein [Bacteroidia bacterium]|nr:glycosyltransferase family 2 protein [Bacteroidia bacterium]
MTPVAVVILNYNGQQLLRQFLPTVIAYSSGASMVVIDNGSTDGSQQLLATTFPSVRIIQLDKNYGFCGGYNRGLAQVAEEIVVLLNSDVEVTPDWLAPLTTLLDGDKSIASVQPKILSFHKRDTFEYAGAGGGLIDALGYPFCRGRLFAYAEKDEGQYNDERPVFWSSGACMAVRLHLFKELGGFDEDFFAHMEEIDLCWKLHRLGYKVYYTGHSVVYHVGAGTLAYQSPRKTYLNFRNGLTMIFKHFSVAEVSYKFPIRIGLDWIACALFIVKGQFGNATAVLQAHVSFMLRLKDNIAKRRAWRTDAASTARDNTYRGSIVWDYYLLGKKRIVDQ